MVPAARNVIRLAVLSAERLSGREAGEWRHRLEFAAVQLLEVVFLGKFQSLFRSHVSHDIQKTIGLH